MASLEEISLHVAPHSAVRAGQAMKDFFESAAASSMVAGEIPDAADEVVEDFDVQPPRTA